MTTTANLDARNLNCPLPILRTKKPLKDLSTGDTLEILATDPGSVKDLQAFCAQTGNKLLSSDEKAGEFQFVIRNS